MDGNVVDFESVLEILEDRCEGGEGAEGSEAAEAARKRRHICSQCNWVVPCSSAVHGGSAILCELCSEPEKIQELEKAIIPKKARSKWSTPKLMVYDLAKDLIRRDVRDYAQMRVLDGNVPPPYTFEAVSEILATKLKFDKGAWYYDDYLQKWLPYSEDSKRLKPSVDAILPVFPIESSAGIAPGRHVAGNVALTSITLNIAKNVYGPDVILFYLQAVSIMQEEAGLLDDLANLTSAADLVPLGPRIRQRAQAQSKSLGVIASRLEGAALRDTVIPYRTIDRLDEARMVPLVEYHNAVRTNLEKYLPSATLLANPVQVHTVASLDPASESHFRNAPPTDDDEAERAEIESDRRIVLDAVQALAPGQAPPATAADGTYLPFQPREGEEWTRSLVYGHYYGLYHSLVNLGDSNQDSPGQGESPRTLYLAHCILSIVTGGMDPFSGLPLRAGTAPRRNPLKCSVGAIISTKQETSGFSGSCKVQHSGSSTHVKFMVVRRRRRRRLALVCPVIAAQRNVHARRPGHDGPSSVTRRHASSSLDTAAAAAAIDRSAGVNPSTGILRLRLGGRSLQVLCASRRRG